MKCQALFSQKNTVQTKMSSTGVVVSALRVIFLYINCCDILQIKYSDVLYIPFFVGWLS